MPTSPQSQRRQDLQVHELTASATDEEVRRVMRLSAEVFHFVPGDPNTHISFDYWRQQLSLPGANIVYVSRLSDPDKLLGFFFNFPRSYEEFEGETLFIWLAGVAADARGLGIFPMLLEKTVDYARALGYPLLSVNTVPSVFKQMFRILESNGWEVVSWKGSDIGPKVLMRLKL